jgi:hypothetical protein
MTVPQLPSVETMMATTGSAPHRLIDLNEAPW